ncbi:hypothetical protein B0T25DRAFT_536567 [Lasiosphaeria hispida]|uniref:Uncharacterized protein n=1 Tax=Lasiosphaeria hispida TaxID=260671 RepID=A0AAJ0HK30_9PEZI|nr:hypothetical protein B0T25DRAFT_536567 [Lasiosphaeria hispida]
MNPNGVIGLRASARGLLSALFRHHDPTTQLEALESDLITIETYLGRLKAVLNDQQEVIDWGGFLHDLQSALDELQETLKNDGDAMQLAGSADPGGVKRIMQFSRDVPIYSLLLDAALAVVSNQSGPPTPASDAKAGTFVSLNQAIEAFQKGSMVPASSSRRRLTGNFDALDSEMQSRYGCIVWSLLCADTRAAFKNCLAPEHRLSLAASWICAPNVQPPEIGLDEPAALQPLLNTLKAAAILLDQDACSAGPSSRLSELVAKHLESEVLRQINAFYKDGFDVPNYRCLLDCNFDLSRSLQVLKEGELAHKAFLKSSSCCQQQNYPISRKHTPTIYAGRDDTSLPASTRQSMLSERVDSSYGSAITNSPDQRALNKYSPWEPRAPSPAESSTGQLVHQDDDGLQTLPSSRRDDEGLQLLPRDMMDDPQIEQQIIGVLGNPDLSVDRPPAAFESGLMVRMEEQEIFCQRIEEIERPDDEELLNESIDGSPPGHFYQDIECVRRPDRSVRFHHTPAKVRLFKSVQIRTLDVYTEFEGPLPRKVDHQSYNTSAELVPKYAFVDDEVPEIYFRWEGNVTGHRYNFLSHQRGSPRTHLQGFQGAVLGLLFQGGYRLASVTRSGGLMTKDEIMAESSIQFWSDRKHNHNSSLAEMAIVGRRPRDLTHDALDKFKNSFPCPRIFIYSKSPQRIIYMLFVDDRVEMKKPSSLFNIQDSELRVQIAANRNISERFRIRKIHNDVFPGIPLDMEGLHYRDQDLSGFKDVKSLTLGFYSKECLTQFEKKFEQLQAVWYQELKPYRHLRDGLKSPRVEVIMKPEKGS